MTAEYVVQSEEAFIEHLWTLEGVRHYREANLRRPEEIGPILDTLTAVLAGLGYSPQDQFGVRVALDEALVNGLRHGNKGNDGKRVRVRYRVHAEGLLAEVKGRGDTAAQVSVSCFISWCSSFFSHQEVCSWDVFAIRWPSISACGTSARPRNAITCCTHVASPPSSCALRRN